MEAATTEQTAGRVVLVGIAGTTRSGKSTLASRLQENFPHSIIIHADRYWQVRKPRHEETGFPNWECPEAVDYIALGKSIDESITKAQKLLVELSMDKIYIFVEGFLLFANESIRNRFNYEILLTISKRSCWMRRQSTKPVPARYFDAILWPSFVKYNAFDILLGDESTSSGRAKLLILDSDSMDAATIYQAASDFLQGKPVDTHVDSHMRNLADTTDLSRHIAYYEKIDELMSPEDEASAEPIEALISRKKEQQLEQLRPRKKTAKSQEEATPDKPESKFSCVIH